MRRIRKWIEDEEWRVERQRRKGRMDPVMAEIQMQTSMKRIIHDRTDMKHLHHRDIQKWRWRRTGDIGRDGDEN